MKMTGNTILITGGGSGIGRGLAEAFHRLGNRVIVAGRRQAALEAVATANPGMETAVVDLQDASAIARFATEIVARFPQLNVVLHNAGISGHERFTDAPNYVAKAESILATNVLAPIRLTAALLPHLLTQSDATILTVTSGLAFLPLVTAPTYSASKAALHSYTESLRYQLKGTSVGVVEIVPPYVQTELEGPQQATDPRAMPLTEFIAEVMSILQAESDVREVCVQRVGILRDVAERGRAGYFEFFTQFNKMFEDAVH